MNGLKRDCITAKDLCATLLLNLRGASRDYLDQPENNNNDRVSSCLKADPVEQATFGLDCHPYCLEVGMCQDLSQPYSLSEAVVSTA